MEYSVIVRCVIYLCALIFGGLALWYQGNAKVSGRVAALIQRAEGLYSDLTNAGGVKFEWVVGQLYSLLPLAVRPFVPRKLVEQVVQTTFDAIEGYARMQLDKLTGGDREAKREKDCEVLG